MTKPGKQTSISSVPHHCVGTALAILAVRPTVCDYLKVMCVICVRVQSIGNVGPTFEKRSQEELLAKGNRARTKRGFCV